MNECICCKSKNLNQIRQSSYFGLPVYQCKNCGLSITGGNESVLKNKLNKLYQDEYWDDRDVKNILKSIYKNTTSGFVRTRIKSQIKYCFKFLGKNKKILEIGSGYGINLLELEKFGYEVTGIEPDKRNVEFINNNLKRGKCIHTFLEDIEITEKFDAIWFSHSLEHLLRPDKSLIKASSLLTEKGIIFIEIPNAKNKIRFESSVNKNPHIYHFTKTSITKLAQNCGFNVLSCDLITRTRNSKEKIYRFFEKYFKVKFENAPYHYLKVNTENEANEIRLILKKI